MHLIDDARQFDAGLGAVDLGDEDLAIEVVELLVEDPDEPDVLARVCCRWVSQAIISWPCRP